MKLRGGGGGGWRGRGGGRTGSGEGATTPSPLRGFRQLIEDSEYILPHITCLISVSFFLSLFYSKKIVVNTY